MEGRGGRREGKCGAEGWKEILAGGIKCIDPNEGEALRAEGGRGEGEEGWGRGGTEILHGGRN